MPRTPKNYYGTEPTTRHLGKLLDGVLRDICSIRGTHPDLVMAAWSEVIGAKLAIMTQAMAFTEGVLYVTVKNSTLLSLLRNTEKHQLVNKLRQKFPQTDIKTIVFRMG